ncbi:MAG: 4-hydroxy-tetrahydrodipicolinate reductase [Burkholderiales bacterium]|nr:4-hydroxy-tetrahydrodipicolinate reductase [Burkholderiales bacterium]
MRVAIAGASGRMGQTLIDMVTASPTMLLTAALEQKGNPSIGREAGAFLGKTTGVTVSDDIEKAVRASDVFIDFTRPAGTLAHAKVCGEVGCAMVIGTTGFKDEEKRALSAFGKKIPIVWASNMSVGVTVLKQLIETAAQKLRGYDIEIVEMHHKHKVDAPSGTSLLLGEAAAKGVGVALKEKAVFTREGIIGERPAGTIGFATLRGGDVVGDHTVMFCGEGERIELSHRASSRKNFGAGALLAAAFVAQRRAENKPGIYSMEDVLF